MICCLNPGSLCAHCTGEGQHNYSQILYFMWFEKLHFEVFLIHFFKEKIGTDRVYGVQGGSLVKTSLKVFTLYLTLYCFIFVFAYLQFCISVGKQHLCTERHLGEN